MKGSKKIVPLSLSVVLLTLLVAAPLAPIHPVNTQIGALLSGTPNDHPAVGDTWTYNTTKPFNSDNYVNLTTTVTGIATVEDWNGTAQCYNYSTTLPPSTTANVSRLDIFIRISDGSKIAYAMYRFLNIGDLILEMYVYCYYNESIREYAFPLSEGLEWNTTAGPYLINMTGYSHQYAAGSWTNTTLTRNNATQTGPFSPSTCKVLNITTIAVPAGTFETWCINRTDTFEYYSPTVKNYVKLVNATDGTTISELVSYSVSYPTQTAIMIISMLIIMFALNSQQSVTMRSYIYIAIGLGVIAATAVGILLWRRRR